MNFVLDTSITMAWCFSDEATSHSVAVLEKLEYESAIVPMLWALEVGNVLIMAERRKRINHAGIAEFLGLLEKLPIKTDSETGTRALRETLLLARHEKLTTYDATYLELAMRLGIPLATKDIQLKHAAKALGVECL